MKDIEVAFTKYVPDIGQLEQYIIKKTGAIPSATSYQPPAIGSDEQQAAGSRQMEALLNVNYETPELRGLSGWINSSGYNLLSELRGKVVIIDFWTYSCINCIRTLPYLQKRYETYKDD